MDTKKSGQRYDREFKENAVALVQGGRTATQVARDLAFPLGRSTGGSRRPEQAPLRASRRRSLPRLQSSANCVACGRKTNTCAASAIS